MEFMTNYIRYDVKKQILNAKRKESGAVPNSVPIRSLLNECLTIQLLGVTSKPLFFEIILDSTKYVKANYTVNSLNPFRIVSGCAGLPGR